MASAIQNIFRFLSKVEATVLSNFGLRPPTDHFAVALVHVPHTESKQNLPSVRELLNDAVLWAVPTKRRTVFKRRNRKFGWPEFVWKPLTRQPDILVCRECGGYYKAKHLCQTCYAKVKIVTQEMQDAIEAKLGYEAVEQEVVVVYQGEEITEENAGKKIVEIPKERPEVFSKNLLQPTTQRKQTTTNVALDELA